MVTPYILDPDNLPAPPLPTGDPDDWEWNRHIRSWIEENQGVERLGDDPSRGPVGSAEPAGSVEPNGSDEPDQSDESTGSAERETGEPVVSPEGEADPPRGARSNDSRDSGARGGAGTGS
jgi:hypothetical protein